MPKVRQVKLSLIVLRSGHSDRRLAEKGRRKIRLSAGPDPVRPDELGGGRAFYGRLGFTDYREGAEAVSKRYDLGPVD